MAVRIGRLPDSSLISRQLASTRLVLCAAPRYLKRRGTPQHPSELAQHDILGYSLMAMGDQWQFIGPDGPVNAKVRPRMWSNNAGIQLQPTFLIDQELASGRLVEVLPEFRSAELGIYAVYPSKKFVLPKVRVLVDFLMEKFADSSWISTTTRLKSNK